MSLSLMGNEMSDNEKITLLFKAIAEHPGSVLVCSRDTFDGIQEAARRHGERFVDERFLCDETFEIGEMRAYESLDKYKAELAGRN